MYETWQLWLPVLIFLGIHQLEEVILSINAWSHQHPLPDWARFVNRALMIKIEPLWQRVLLVAIQALIFGMLVWLTGSNTDLLRVLLTILVVVWTAAFGLHIALSRATRSWMPGTYTSIPGIPVGLALLWWLWR